MSETDKVAYLKDEIERYKKIGRVATIALIFGVIVLFLTYQFQWEFYNIIIGAGFLIGGIIGGAYSQFKEDTARTQLKERK